MNYSIVPMAEEHIASFYETICYVISERKYLAFLEPPPFVGTQKFVRENIEKGIAQMAVISDGRCVGWCDILPQTSRQASAHVGIVGMGLMPEFRGRGIGEQLLRATIDTARAKGLTRIELTVRENNLNAIALYKKIGFVAEGLKVKAHRNADGTYENIFLMALLF